MAEEEWDVFISHASEDKDSVARPLAEVLRKAAVRVWLDDHELKLGDSLSGKIDEGLAHSRFGVVILSPAFLIKHWPKKELSGLRAREEEGRKVILPVWHAIDKNTLMSFSPTLADSVAINTEAGIDTVAKSILDVIFHPDSASPSLVHPTVLRRLFLLIESNPCKDGLLNFLQLHNLTDRHVDNVVWTLKAGKHVVDLCMIKSLKTTPMSDLSFVNFAPYWNSPVMISGEAKPLVASEIVNAVREMRLFRQWLKMSLEHVPRPAKVAPIFELKSPQKEFFHNLQLSSWASHIDFYRCRFKIYAGRRGALDRDTQLKDVWVRYLRKLNKLDVRTYDTLIERGQV